MVLRCPHCRHRHRVTAEQRWAWPWGWETQYRLPVHWLRGESVYRGIACRGSELLL